ncbi:MAG: hypothetical protein WBZ42_02000 [Halobacteriota archaeon]
MRSGCSTKDEKQVREMHFNLHDILKFIIKGPSDTTRFIGKHYSHFFTDQVVHPDLEFIICKFKANNSHTELINNKYYVKEDQFYCKDAYKFAKWQICIQGLGAEETKIFFDGNRISFPFLHTYIIEPLLAYKLTNMGHSVLHASSIDVGGKGFTFAGYPGSGKTSILLELINRGHKYLSDELTLLDHQGMLHSCAAPVNIYAYNLACCPSFQKKMTKKCLMGIYLKDLIHRLSLGYMKLPHAVDLEALSYEIADQSPLEAIILLSRSTDQKTALGREIDKKELAARLSLMSSYQFYRFYEYLNAYSTYIPENMTYNVRVFENILYGIRNATCYEVEVPMNQTQSIVTELRTVLQE